MVDSRPHIFVNKIFFQIIIGNMLIVELLPILSALSASCIRTLIGKIQGRIMAKFGNGSSPSLRPGLSPCTIGQYPSFPVVFIAQSKGPALNQLDFVVEALSHAVGIAMPNVAHNRFKPPA